MYKIKQFTSPTVGQQEYASTPYPLERKLFVNHLNRTTNDRILCKAFSPFGNILSCEVAMTKEGICKGFAYVEFENHESVNKCIKCMNGKVLDGRKINVTYFIPRYQRRKYKVKKNYIKEYNNIVVRNLEAFVDKKYLQNIFNTFGTIISIKVSVNLVCYYYFLIRIARNFCNCNLNRIVILMT